MVEKLEGWKIVGGRNYARKKHNKKEIKNNKNYYKELEDKEDNDESKTKLDFEKLYYKHIRENKISYDYVYYQLDKSKIAEENYKVEKIIIQVLVSMIDQLVRYQVKESEMIIMKIK